MVQKHPENEIEELTEETAARRSFLATAGKLAAYTPPLMLGLLMPGERAIASGGAYADPVFKPKEKKKKKKKKKP